MIHAMKHCDRPWWKRPPVWFITIAAVMLLVVVRFEIRETGEISLTPYGAFFDQLEAGVIESVTIQGTEIHGSYKRSPSSTQHNSFRTQVPDFGDPALMPELRKQHVTINVGTPSLWTAALAHVPWPMLVFLIVVLVAGLIRLVRGGAAPSVAAGSMPTHGMMGVVSGLFQHRDQAAPPTRESDEPKSR